MLSALKNLPFKKFCFLISLALLFLTANAQVESLFPFKVDFSKEEIKLLNSLDKKSLEKLLQIAAAKIVYVSCNASTQARDLALLDVNYKVTRVQPVDMFPHTHHVENVVLLELR